MIKDIKIEQRWHYKNFSWVQEKMEKIEEDFNGLKV